MLYKVFPRQRRVMNFLFVLVAFLATENALCIEISQDELNEWEDFKVTHSKVYETQGEETKRKLIFVDNLQFIREHNKRHEKGEVTYTLGINEFADLTVNEFNDMLNGFKPSGIPKFGKVFVKPENLDLPNRVDWRWKGAVTRVKNQKDCGSCWAFSSTGALEAANFLNTSKLVSLSEQNLIDCTISYGNGACYGGYTSKAMQYVIDNQGIDTEKTYPYKDSTDYVCRYNASHKGGTATAYTNIPWGDDDALLAAVATVAPISIGIQSSLRTFHLYKTGVYYDSACSYNNINHAVLLVGYGKTLFRKRPYWLIKNSWGWTWGEFGYMRMARNQTNMCGISSEALYPTL